MTERDDKITAFLDGSMTDDEMAAFENAMIEDPALADEVARLAGNDDLLRAAFDAPMHEPVDQALLERMGLAEPKTASVASPPLAANDNPPFWRRWQWAAGGAIAASLALVLLTQTDGQGGDAFSNALDATPSMITAQLDDGTQLTPRLTFSAKDGRFCREFVETRPNESETGIACRIEDQWKVEARIKEGSAPSGNGGFATASGEDTAKLDAAYQALGASDPISADDERALIEKRWASR
jgi:hypothetical protein